MGSPATMFPVTCCALFVAVFNAANADTVSVSHEDESRSNCPDGWLDATYLGIGCLLFNSSTGYTWDQAIDFCYSQEGDLVEIRNSQEMEFVISYLLTLETHETAYDWWTAGMDAGREGRWIWPSSLSIVESYVWDAGEPDGGSKQNCLCLPSTYSYKGHDCDCDVSRRLICQKK